MPERYLTKLDDDTWSIRDNAPDPRKYVFGFGRRICPGMHIAEQGLFAIMTTVLHTLNVERIKDASGNEVVPEPLVSSGALTHVRPFPYQIRVWDDARELVDACAPAVDQSC
jgi:cytochrome P450